jgi:PAS domain S-box-containing protein
MAHSDDIKKKPSDLRKRAEEAFSNKFPVQKDASTLSREEVERLVHELSVHQIELEMQNEELREAHNLLSESRDRLSDLYDSAPVGYFTLGKDGLILEVNLTGAALLAADRSSLIGKPFQRFLVKEYADAFYHHMQGVFMAVTKHRSEVELQKSDGTSFLAQLESLAIADRDETVTRCRTIVSDITERKRAEEALWKSEERQRYISDLIADFGFSCIKPAGGEFVIDSLVGAVEKITGYSIEEIQSHGSWRFLVHPFDMPIFEKKVIGLSPGETSDCELRIVSKEGLTRWIRASSAVIGDSKNPRSHRLIGSCEEITNRKLAELLSQSRMSMLDFAATHSLEELLQYTLDEVGRITDSPIGFYHFVEADQKTLSLQAWSSRTVKEFCTARGKGFHYPIDDAGVWVDCVRQGQPVIHNDYMSLPHRKGLPEGHAAVMRELAAPIFRNDLVVAILGVRNKPQDYTPYDVEIVTYLADFAWEITNRKRSEEALRESEARLDLALRSAQMGAWCWDIVEGRRHFDHQVCHLLGIDQATFTGSEQDFFAVVHPDDWEGVKAALARTIEQDVPYEPEHRAIWPDGSVHYITAHGGVVRDDKGRPLRMNGILWDITERKLMEESLRESEERLRLALEATNDGIWDWDIATGNARFSQHWYTMLGYEPNELPQSYDSWRRLVHPDDIERAEREIKKHITSGEGYSIELRMKNKSGGWQWIQTRGRVVERTADGHAVRMVGTHSDITERKLGEETLSEAERKYRSIFENSREGIYQSTAEGRYLTVNPAMASIYGYSSPEEMVSGITSIDQEIFVIPEKRGELKQLIATKGAVRDFEVEQRRKDGSIFWASFNVHAVYADDGTCLYWEGRSIDITERVRQEREIRLLNRLYSVLSQVSHAVVQATTAEAFLLETCRVIVEEGGFVLSWIGRVEAETNAVVPVATWGKAGEYVRGITVYADDRPEGRGPTGACLRERRPSVHNDFLNSPLTKPWREWAQPFSIRASAAFPIEPGGRAWGALTIYSDEVDFFGIEDVKLLERVAGSIGFALDNFERERQRRLAQQESERLEIQLRQAQKMEAIGTLAGGIAHDFNNILAIILGFTEMSLTETSRTTPLGQRLEQVLKATHRAKHLVQQILSFGRKAQTERVPLNASPIIKEALNMLRASLPTTIEMCTDIEASCEVQADPTQLHQVLMNLCTNAAHAMKEEGGILRISLANVDFDATVPHPDLFAGPYIKLSVSDTGKGMTPEVVGRIFDPFFTTKGPDEGTGLGLSVAYGIVKNHQGAITVDSEPGKGSTFHVFLPRIEVKDAPEPAIAMQPPTGKEQVLYVDDEKALADLGRLMLEALGYKVESFTSSVEALKAFEAQPDKFDIVITDMTMPHLTGVKLAKEVMRLRPQIPVILCSGFSDLITPEKALEMGIAAMLMKPLTLAKLAATVRQILDDKKAMEV